ncbi:hypothetical protein SAMN05880501_11758 [Ureibacillus xyleni]|uniref:Uncharacterized protein n=1 Tax=Ureibacillus xyleni TaxID=614648 RepID=A0A285TP24_9BACL|nr:hypothetical protein [Ureibacillus xyleni]SOC24570.1 hypothetical protein SAMN05880501_11758 [Ureibacillus xyleni]
MKTFDSVTDFINHYNNRQTISTSVSITLNGNEHTFLRTSTHSNDKIAKRMFDSYQFVEEENYGLGIELTVNYYRYFEMKIILEAYFSFYHDKETFLLSPFYFYDKFVSDEDFEQYKDSISDSLEKWTGLKWVNINRVQNAFNDIRLNTYMKAHKDLAYELPFHIYKDEESSMVTNFIDLKRKDKWKIDEEGKSRYFTEPLVVPEYW